MVLSLFPTSKNKQIGSVTEISDYKDPEHNNQHYCRNPFISRTSSYRLAPGNVWCPDSLLSTMRCSCDLEHLNTHFRLIQSNSLQSVSCFNIQIGRFMTHMNINIGDSKCAKNLELPSYSIQFSNLYTHLPLEQVRVQIFPP